jgi:Methyltransferase domain
LSQPRRVEPELLDHLPADDPRAIQSRRDLKRINVVMRHAGIMARTLLKRSGGRKPSVIADLGSGDGNFMLSVARKLAPHWPGVTVVLLDQRDIVSAETRAAFAALGWTAEPVSADVFSFLENPGRPAVDIVTANLFLHHFEPEGLSRLFKCAADLAWLFVACEPRRGTLGREASRLLWLLGCNDVSVQDAVTSARAGFVGRELSAQWPKEGGWTLQEGGVALLTHRFVASRAQG